MVDTEKCFDTQKNLGKNILSDDTFVDRILGAKFHLIFAIESMIFGKSTHRQEKCNIEEKVLGNHLLSDDIFAQSRLDFVLL